MHRNILLSRNILPTNIPWSLHCCDWCPTKCLAKKFAKHYVTKHHSCSAASWKFSPSPSLHKIINLSACTFFVTSLYKRSTFILINRHAFTLDCSLSLCRFTPEAVAEGIDAFLLARRKGRWLRYDHQLELSRLFCEFVYIAWLELSCVILVVLKCLQLLELQKKPV